MYTKEPYGVPSDLHELVVPEEKELKDAQEMLGLVQSEAGIKEFQKSALGKVSEILRASGHFCGAKECLDKALLIDPKDPELYEAYMSLLLNHMDEDVPEEQFAMYKNPEERFERISQLLEGMDLDLYDSFCRLLQSGDEELSFLRLRAFSENRKKLEASRYTFLQETSDILFPLEPRDEKRSGLIAALHEL